MTQNSKYIIVGAAALALIGGYYLYTRNSAPPTPANTKDASTTTPQVQTSDNSKNLEKVNKPLLQNWSEFKNEKFGIKFEHPGIVVIEKADLFPLMKICTEGGECFSHVIIQPHDGSSIEGFLSKAFAEVKDRLKIDVKTISTKKTKLYNVDAVEVEYQYIYPSPLNRVISYWSVVAAANNNIYFFQHFSPQLNDIETAKKIASTLQITEAKSNGALYVQAQQFELELPSLLFRPNKNPSPNTIVDFVVQNETATVLKSVKIIAYPYVSSLDNLMQEFNKSHAADKPSQVAAFSFVSQAFTGKAFTYSSSAGHFVDVCFSVQNKFYIASAFCNSGDAKQFQVSSLKQISNLKLLKDVVSNSTYVYVNSTSGFKASFPTSNLSLFTEHIDEDPVITFIYSDLCETNISCITPDVPATSIEQVKNEIAKGLQQDEEGSSVKVLETFTKQVNNVDCVQFIYIQQMLYSQVTFKWMLTSFLHNKRVYHIRSYAYEDAWKPDLVGLFNSIVNKFELI